MNIPDEAFKAALSEWASQNATGEVSDETKEKEE